MLYRQQQQQSIFILKNLQFLKISKYRSDTSKKIVKYEKRLKWFIFCPLINMYEWYENWQKNKNSNIKS